MYNKEMVMNFYIFTHGDQDGVVAAKIVKYRYPEAEVIFVDYNNMDDTIAKTLPEIDPTQDRLWMLDMCPSEATMQSIHDMFMGHHDNLYCADHHTQPHIGQYMWAENDLSKCGAQMAANKLADEGLGGELLQYWGDIADAWDNWKLDSPLRPLSENVETLRKFWGNRWLLEKPDFPEFNDHDVLLLDHLARKRDRYIDFQVNNLDRAIRRNDFIMTFMNHNISEAANAILQRYDTIRYVANINLEYRTVNLRSKTGSKDDVSLIGKQFQGGGRMNTGGFPLTNEMLLDLKDLFNEIYQAIFDLRLKKEIPE
jgi:oligoribonuclease NrnB/cAMP/cGMP phosphodiesterase (DHH superfamily)